MSEASVLNKRATAWLKRDIGVLASSDRDRVAIGHRDRDYALTTPTSFVHNLAHGKRPVHRISAQGSEK